MTNLNVNITGHLALKSYSVGMRYKFNTLIEINVNTLTANIKANYDKKGKSDILSKPKL